MSFNIDINLQQLIDNYVSPKEEERKLRRKGNDPNSGRSGTNEYFTPYSIVIKMMDNIEPEIWADPNKTSLDPSSGSGNIVVGILYRRIVEYNIHWRTALKTCYALDLMQDNVDEMKQRVHDMLSQICPDYDHNEAQETMDCNFVCSDFFKWNFEEWRAYTEDELKQIEKDKKKKR